MIHKPIVLNVRNNFETALLIAVRIVSVEIVGGESLAAPWALQATPLQGRRCADTASFVVAAPPRCFHGVQSGKAGAFAYVHGKSQCRLCDGSFSFRGPQMNRFVGKIMISFDHSHGPAPGAHEDGVSDRGVSSHAHAAQKR
jgi:hypothetical protein